MSIRSLIVARDFFSIIDHHLRSTRARPIALNNLQINKSFFFLYHEFDVEILAIEKLEY